MQSPNPHRSTSRLDGVVSRVDPVCRELDVRATGAAVRIDVPPDCPITLRGERVKLRLLQPQDRVRVFYAERHDGRVASRIEVQPTAPTAA